MCFLKKESVGLYIGGVVRVIVLLCVKGWNLWGPGGPYASQRLHLDFGFLYKHLSNIKADKKILPNLVYDNL